VAIELSEKGKFCFEPLARFSNEPLRVSSFKGKVVAFLIEFFIKAIAGEKVRVVIGDEKEKMKSHQQDEIPVVSPLRSLELSPRDLFQPQQLHNCASTSKPLHSSHLF
jgi:hypothetical protein